MVRGTGIVPPRDRAPPPEAGYDGQEISLIKSTKFYILFHSLHNHNGLYTMSFFSFQCIYEVTL